MFKLILIIWFGAIVPGVLICQFIIKQKKTVRSSSLKIRIFNRIYLLLSKIPIVKKSVFEVKNKLYINNLWDETMLRYKAAFFYLISWGTSVVGFVLALIFFHDNFYVLCVLMFFCYEVKSLVLGALISDGTDLLEGLITFISDLSKNYKTDNNVINAIKKSIKMNTNYLTVVHMEKILHVIGDRKKVDTYIAECPSEFLSMITLNCHLINEFGDIPDEKENSTFCENMSFINQNIELELFKRRELKYWIKGLPFYCIMPLLMMALFDFWIKNIGTILQEVYQTSLIFIIKIIISLASIVCFYIVQNYKTTSRILVSSNKIEWEKYLLRITAIRKFIKLLCPKENSKRHYRFRDLIAYSGVYTKIEYIYLRKVLFVIGTFFICLSLSFTMHKINYSNILKDNTSDFKIEVISINGKQMESTYTENDILSQLDKDKDSNSNIEFAKKILADKGLTDKEQLDSLSKKIVEKKEALQNEFIKWWEYIVAIIVAALSSIIPEESLRLKVKSKRFDMENECILLETIILILKNHEIATQKLVLNYMIRFSMIFKRALEDAAKKIKKGESKALEALLEETNYPPFTALILNLIKVDEMKTKDAFSDLDQNRRNFILTRRGEYEKLIEDRKANGIFVARIPFALFMVLYVVGPIYYLAFSQAVDISNKIGQVDSLTNK